MDRIDYNAIAKAFANYRAASITDVVIGFENVADQLRPLDGKRVLDYGCGAGHFARFLRNQGANVTAVDVSPEMIALAQDNDALGIAYHVCESGDIHFLPSESFDAVTMNFVLPAIGRRDVMLHVLKETNRVLHSQGELVTLRVNWDKAHGKEFMAFALDTVPEFTSGMKVSGILKGAEPIRVEEYYWSPEEYAALLTEAGFAITKVFEPLASGDAHPWVNEKEVPPFVITVAKKER